MDKYKSLVKLADVVRDSLEDGKISFIEGAHIALKIFKAQGDLKELVKAQRNSTDSELVDVFGEDAGTFKQIIIALTGIYAHVRNLIDLFSQLKTLPKKKKAPKKAPTDDK